MNNSALIKSIKDITVFEDEDYIALNKPPHISTLDERAEGIGTSLLKVVRKEIPGAQACHRLDKETSGLILFAKNPEAYRNASMQFEHRQTTKVYHAVVNGVHDLEGVHVNLPILPLKTGVVKIDKLGGKHAETLFQTLKAYYNASLIECFPITGRMHQIRIHLSCLKAPIVNDTLYGGQPLFLSEVKRGFKMKKEDEEQPLIQRIALHAYGLSFMKMNQERIMVNAPYPKDFKALINQLEKHS